MGSEVSTNTEFQGEDIRDLRSEVVYKTLKNYITTRSKVNLSELIDVQFECFHSKGTPAGDIFFIIKDQIGRAHV